MSVMSRIDSVTVGNDMSRSHVTLSFQTKKEEVSSEDEEEA